MKKKQVSDSKQKGTAKKVKTLIHDRKTIRSHYYCEGHCKCTKIFKTIFKEGKKKDAAFKLQIKDPITSKKPLAQSCSYDLIKEGKQC